jgi:hypothetical protein
MAVSSKSYDSGKQSDARILKTGVKWNNTQGEDSCLHSTLLVWNVRRPDPSPVFADGKRSLYRIDQRWLAKRRSKERNEGTRSRSMTIGVATCLYCLDWSGMAARRPVLALSALGVVFGDIGTSPLYTFKIVLALAGKRPDPKPSSSRESINSGQRTGVITPHDRRKNLPASASFLKFSGDQF